MTPTSWDKGARRRPSAAALTDQRGGGLAPGLIAVSLLALGALGALKALGGTVSDKAECAGQAVASMGPLRCAAAPASPGQAPFAAAPAAPEAGPEAPAPGDGGSLVVLPFPGTSASVSCTARPCKDRKGMRVQATGEVSVQRRDTRLDSKSVGCPRQDLAVSAKLQLEGNASARVSGALSVFTGTASKYNVSVSPEAADAIERGERPPPNPVDPRSIATGESIELSEEFYAGHELTAIYRQMRLAIGFDEGRRMSSGVRKVDDAAVRIMVGDADFVRQALSPGVSAGGPGLAVGGGRELSHGSVRAVDIDLSTPAGWAAYQQFLATGKMPSGGGDTYSLMMEAVDPSHIQAYEHVSGVPLERYDGNNVRLDFTESDLRALQSQALDQLDQLAKDSRVDLTRDDMERMLREEPSRLEDAGLNSALDHVFEIAAGQSTADILGALSHVGGPTSDGSAAMQNLVAFMNATARARHGDRKLPRVHSDSVLPGTSAAATCK